MLPRDAGAPFFRIGSILRWGLRPVRRLRGARAFSVAPRRGGGHWYRLLAHESEKSSIHLLRFRRVTRYPILSSATGGLPGESFDRVLRNATALFRSWARGAPAINYRGHRALSLGHVRGIRRGRGLHRRDAHLSITTGTDKSSCLIQKGSMGAQAWSANDAHRDHIHPGAPMSGSEALMVS